MGTSWGIFLEFDSSSIGENIYLATLINKSSRVERASFNFTRLSDESGRPILRVHTQSSYYTPHMHVKYTHNTNTMSWQLYNKFKLELINNFIWEATGQSFAIRLHIEACH
jgi:hypothetical protein